MIGPLTALGRLWFATRKLRLPIPADALVLEVGSGDSPCPRSDVLLDLTLEDHERVGGRTVVDRTLVLGTVEKLPFRDKVFDYAIAFHVLEHSPNPTAFLRELERVAHAGYIETPAAWVERVNPLTMHRSEVGIELADGGERLLIRHKESPLPDSTLREEFLRSAANGWFERVPRREVVTQFDWSGTLPFRVINPETRIDWPSPPETTKAGDRDPRSALRKTLKRAAQWTHTPRRVDLMALLRCTDCGHAPLESGTGHMICRACGRAFGLAMAGVPLMHPKGWSLR